MSRPILINAASCVAGGGVQVADGLIRTILSPTWNSRPWVLALSKQVQASLGDLPIKVPHVILSERPGDLIWGRETRRLLKKFADEQKVSSVFTVFGPSYVRFGAPEIMGFANGFMLAEGSEHFANHPVHRRIVSRLKKIFRRQYLNHADAFWVETESARARLATFMRRSTASIYVIPNAVNPSLPAPCISQNNVRSDLLCLAAAYWHKNHHMLVEAAVLLEREKNLPSDWRFVTTLDEKSAVWKSLREQIDSRNLEKRFHNVGVVPITQCHELFSRAILLVHPSLLETFSATYLEAMWFGVPMAVSDRDFAHEICGDSAVYFDPLSAPSIARTLAALIRDDTFRAYLVEKGRTRLATFPSSRQKYEKMAELAVRFSDSAALTNFYGIK